MEQNNISPDQMQDAYNVSVHAQKWDEEALEAGETNDRSTLIENDDYDTDELKVLMRELAIDTPSSSTAQDHMWFSSSTPVENGEYFEQGIHTYYTLAIHSVNGEKPAKDDYERIAQLAGIKFQNSIARPAP